MAKAQVHQPKGLRAGELAQPHRCSTWESDSGTLGSTVKLDLKAWIWVSCPRGQESKRTVLNLLLMAALGGPAKAVLENLI